MVAFLMFQRVMAVYHKFTNYLAHRNTSSFEKSIFAYLAKQSLP